MHGVQVQKYLRLFTKHKSHESDFSYALAVCSMKNRTWIHAATCLLLKLLNYA